MSLKSDINRYTPRQEQTDALNFIVKTKTEKPDTKFFLLNMPVGIGKSHLSMMISDWYTSKIDVGSKVDIITAGKILQDQYDDTYESINNLKGKENYECAQYACSCANGKEFNRLNKTSCDFCPYDDAKGGYIGGRVSLTNFYLYLIYALYNNGVMDQRKANVLIVDECHEFDDVMSDFVSIKITETTVKKLKFTNEDDILKKLKKVGTITQYITFLEYLKGEVIQTIDDVDKSMQGGRNIKQDKRDLRISKITGVGGNSDVKLMQVISDLKQYQLKIDLFLKEYKENPHNWVLETYFNEKTDQKELSLEPIWAYDYLDKYVWSKYDMVILMSGTILDKRLFSELNGLDEEKTVYYSVPSPFPVENRPIYYMPLGKMSYAKKEETFKNYVTYLHKLLKKYEGKKGIIHTNSFELSNWIQRGVDNPRLVFHESSNKDEMLRKHFETEDPTVFVSPSVGTGVSFDHDRSRFQIIAKIPYPSLGSQKNKMRQKNNPEWYAWKTVCGLLQMTGRSVRSKTDFADTIIIDGSFSDILKYSSHLIPDWLQVAIKRIDVKVGS
jgi:ATP-dependent DNA helicase DinG